MATKNQPPRLPPIIDGCETSGPSHCRPSNAEIGHPYWDEDLEVLLLKTDKPEPDDWSLANGGYVDDLMEAATARFVPASDSDDYSPLDDGESTALDDPTSVLPPSDDDDELIDFSDLRGS